ncbi:Cytochrome P450 [Variovorax sp. NFACC28]|nr:Cytochrome P450 [Variovorax sp. NFACC28]SEG98877.1 Cytochrome P450 [Variovorax sp. NFACC29]SFE15884.1 Cytochrome P450 [Variovorax sp. NFACC26]SFH20154.1 Cytochrome P450 [Variovorax sp. NFACC27]
MAMDATLLDPFSPQALADPYPVYRRLREQSPVHPVAPGRWIVSRHADVLALLRDPRCAHWGHAPELDALRSPHERALAQALRLFAPSDPPGALRRQMSAVFNTQVLERMPQRLAPLADRLLDGLGGHGGGGGLDGLDGLGEGRSHDVLAAYAHPLTMQAVGDMLGLSDAQTLALAQAMGGLDGSLFEGLRGAGIAAPASGPVARLQGCMDALIDQAQDRPDALISGLHAAVDAQGPAADRRDRLLNALLVLVYAGHHNMLNFIGNGLLALAMHPQAQARLRQEPALADRAMLELLRHDSPLQYIVLVASEPLALHGREIARGDEVLVCTGSANRDETVFEDPDGLDFARANPMDSLSFGSGAWRCIGARLALRIGATAFSKIVARGFALPANMPALRRVRGPLVQRGLAALPLMLLSQEEGRHG